MRSCVKSLFELDKEKQKERGIARLPSKEFQTLSVVSTASGVFRDREAHLIVLLFNRRAARETYDCGDLFRSSDLTQGRNTQFQAKVVRRNG
jgi:hypothetical protein